MLEIKLYKISDGKNVINKKLTSEKILTGTLKENTSIIRPSITVNRNDELIDYNYLFIPKFKRYYFITDITITNQGFIISASVDVLESFKTAILDYNGTIERQEFDYNFYLVDNEISAYSKSKIAYKTFPNTPFKSNMSNEDKSFVLITTSD